MSPYLAQRTEQGKMVKIPVLLLLLIAQSAFCQDHEGVSQAAEHGPTDLSCRLLAKLNAAKGDEASVRKVLLSLLGNEITGAQVATAILPLLRDSQYSSNLRALAAEATARTCPGQKGEVRDTVEQELWYLLRSDSNKAVRAAAARSLGQYNVRTRNRRSWRPCSQQAMIHLQLFGRGLTWASVACEREGRRRWRSCSMA